MKKTSDDILKSLVSEIKSELSATLQPHVQALVAAAQELLAAIGSGGKHRGRPRKTGKGGRPKTKTIKPARRGKGKRAPRGAFKNTVMGILQEASAPLRPSDIRDKVLATGEFKNHNPKSIYVMVILALPKLPGVKKTAQGYTLKK